jgi:UDP-N-acetylmuramate dehydrogenase
VPNRTLAHHTTLGLGGRACELVVADSTDRLVALLRQRPGRSRPGDDRADADLLLLAGGSNVVIGDDGFPGTVALLRTRGIRATGAGDTVTLAVAAGEPWDEFVDRAVDEGWSGVECLSGVPGSTGATPIQNVGAYGQEVAETISGVTVCDRQTGQLRTMTAAECGFAYRTSNFKHRHRYVVTEVEFSLDRSTVSQPIRYTELARALGVEVGRTAPLAEVRAAVRRLRASKGMLLDPNDPDTRSVGSFFINPILAAADYERFAKRIAEIGLAAPVSWPDTAGATKISAAWLIENAGFARGYGHRGVAISSKHTLALTNRGGTTAALLALAREIRSGVNDRFGVWLEPEPVLVNCAL